MTDEEAIERVRGLARGQALEFPGDIRALATVVAGLYAALLAQREAIDELQEFVSQRLATGPRPASLINVEPPPAARPTEREAAGPPGYDYQGRAVPSGAVYARRP